MTIFDTLENSKPYFLEEFYYKEKMHKLYLYKSFFPEVQKDQYFLKIFHLTEKKEIICEGYIYFYIDTYAKETSFIGAFTKPEYRNLGLSSYLFSYWITFCLENGIDNFTTNKKQRKPFLIYLLKKFGFEIEDTTQYDSSNYTIHICSKDQDNNKYLYFKNSLFGESFAKGKIMRHDNYIILPEINPDIKTLDTILLSTPYYLQDNNLAYKRSRTIQDRYH